MSRVCLHKPQDMLMPVPQNMVYAVSAWCEDHGAKPWLPVAIMTGFQTEMMPLGTLVADTSEQVFAKGEELNFVGRPHVTMALFAFDDGLMDVVDEEDGTGCTFALIFNEWDEHYVAWDGCMDVDAHFHRKMPLQDWVRAVQVPDPEAFEL